MKNKEFIDLLDYANSLPTCWWAMSTLRKVVLKNDIVLVGLESTPETFLEDFNSIFKWEIK